MSASSHPSRRRFLAVLSAFAPTTLVAASCALGQGGLGREPGATLSFDDGSTRVPAPVPGDTERVLVVGAGVAGLTVANALATAGVEVSVVEGRDRVGGRIHTIDVADTPVDLGASWVHDPQAPIRRIFDALSTPLLLAPAFDQWAQARAVDPAAVVFPDVELEAALQAAVASFVEHAPAFALAHPDASVAEAIESILSESSSRVRATLGNLLGVYDGADADQLPLAVFVGFFLSDAGLEARDSFPAHGYRSLVEALGGALDVRTGVRVDTIEDTGSGVRVATSAGEELWASHVVVTCPVPIIRDDIQFVSGLSADKKAALGNAGFGDFEKVALAFSEPFWQLDGATNLIVGSDGASAFRGFLDLSKWHDRPVLLAFSMGGHARMMAGLGHEERVALALDALRCIGRPIPDVVDAASSGWSADPFSRGCYSRAPMGVSLENLMPVPGRLAQPEGRVLFAGEATSLEHGSTVDGAFESGLREAKRLLQRETVDITLSPV